MERDAIMEKIKELKFEVKNLRDAYWRGMTGKSKTITMDMLEGISANILMKETLIKRLELELTMTK